MTGTQRTWLCVHGLVLLSFPGVFSSDWGPPSSWLLPSGEIFWEVLRKIPPAFLSYWRVEAGGKYPLPSALWASAGSQVTCSGNPLSRIAANKELGVELGFRRGQRRLRTRKIPYFVAAPKYWSVQQLAFGAWHPISVPAPVRVVPRADLMTEMAEIFLYVLDLPTWSLDANWVSVLLLLLPCWFLNFFFRMSFCLLLFQTCRK